jgi:peptide/nickel transport system substrate-binding protein
MGKGVMVLEAKTPGVKAYRHKHSLERRKTVKTNLWKLLTAMVVLTMLVPVLAGCATPTPEVIEKIVTQIVKETVKETVIVEGTPQVVEKEVTKIVKEEVQVVVTATPEPKEPKVLVISSPVQYSETFDITTMVYSMEATHMIYDTLVSVDTNYEYHPGGLTERWEVSEDGTVVTFYLKEGIKFHDGSDFNAEAVKWNLEEHVKEGKAVAYMYSAITEIEIIDDYTIALHFEGPFPALFYYLSGSWGLIMSPAEYERLGPDEYASHPSGTGPFTIDEWVFNERIVLVRNPDYNWGAEWTGHEGPANVDKIIHKFVPEDVTRLVELEAGDTHIVMEAPWRELTRYITDPDYQVYQVPEATIWFVGMNVNSPIVSDLRTRQAIGHAIDRDLIQQTLYMGLGRATNTYLAGELAADKGVSEYAPSYDPAAAAGLLAEAGWAMGDDGILVAENVEGVEAGTVFEVEYWTYQDDEARRLAEATQRMLADAGIKANVTPMDKPTYDSQLEAGGHSIILRRYTWDGLDILPWFHDAGYLPYPNYLGVNDPEIDQIWYDSEYSVATWEERSDSFKEGHILLIERWYPWAPIYQRPSLSFARASVKDFEPIPLRTTASTELWLTVDLEE